MYRGIFKFGCIVIRSDMRSEEIATPEVDEPKSYLKLV